MPTAIALKYLPILQVPVPDRVGEILNKLLDAPVILRFVTVCVLIAIVLGFLEKQFKVLDSLIVTLQSIRTRLAGQPEAAPKTQADRDKLLKAVKIKTEQRLRDVLSEEQVIALSWKNRPEDVGRYQRPKVTAEASLAKLQSEIPPAPRQTFWNPLQSIKPRRWLQRLNQDLAEQPKEDIVLDTKVQMMDVFQQGDVAGRLLILGEPGAGKTTTLLELAKELITAAEEKPEAEGQPQAPVPIIFELSAWTNDKQSIEAWLVTQLKDEYNVPIKTGEHWLATHQILPLLDGLDELGMVRQKQCAAKINDFLPQGEPDRQAVVCCRTQEFRRGKVKLPGLNGAVELQPLTKAQIQNYLSDIGQPSLWGTIEQSKELSDLAKKPLMLTLMAVALVNCPAQTQAELFEAYIDERFTHDTQKYGELPYNRVQTLHYLHWLAKNIKHKNQTKFLIEKMQPSLLTSREQKLIYRISVGAIGGCILGGFLGLILLLDSTFSSLLGIEKILAIFFLLILGLLTGGVYSVISKFEIYKTVLSKIKFFNSSLYDLEKGVIDEIYMTEHFIISFNRLKERNLFSGFLYGVTSMTAMGLLLGSFLAIISRLELWLGLLLGLGSGMPAGIAFGFSIGFKSDIQVRSNPNQGIKACARNGVMIAILVGSVCAALFILISISVGLPVIGLVTLSQAMIFALCSSLDNGLWACLQHFVLRIVLWLSKDTPWNYAHFLRYTSELRFTRQTGGEFRFFHDLLREHLATIPSSPYKGEMPQAEG